MSMLTELVIAALALTGFPVGIALSYIAAEELLDGKKYFQYLRRALLLIISLFIIYSLYSTFLALVPVFGAIFVILCLVDLKLQSKIAYFFHYLAFLGGYFLIEEKILLAALIFLYGFPAGTSWRIQDE